jgi:hypothetical protein
MWRWEVIYMETTELLRDNIIIRIDDMEMRRQNFISG